MGPRINDRIRISPVRLIDQDGTMIGVVETDEARRRAFELGLDLVEIAPDVRPPVCRIMDFGKYKYETAKKEKANRSKTKASELKEVRLGRSMKIDPHDVAIRIAQARRFLLDGHKVQIVQNFRGRELAHRSRGDQRMEEVIQQLSDLGRVELAPRLNGKRMSMIISPDRTKIEAYRRKHPELEKPHAVAESGDAKAAAKAARAPKSPQSPTGADRSGQVPSSASAPPPRGADDAVHVEGRA